MYSSSLRQIDATRDQLSQALADCDWERVAVLDLQAREQVDAAMRVEGRDDAGLRTSLEELMAVYRRLIEATTRQRDKIGAEIIDFNRARKATKAFQSFQL